jgi:hypothetical protein
MNTRSSWYQQIDTNHNTPFEDSGNVPPPDLFLDQCVSVFICGLGIEGEQPSRRLKPVLRTGDGLKSQASSLTKNERTFIIPRRHACPGFSIIWFVATMPRVLERCASHQEQESQSRERHRRERMEIGKRASIVNHSPQANAERDRLPILASRLPRIQGIQIPAQPYADRTSSQQTQHPYEKEDGIEPGIHRRASLIFFQTSS